MASPRARIAAENAEMDARIQALKVTVESTLLALVGDGRVRVVSWGVAREMAASA